MIPENNNYFTLEDAVWPMMRLGTFAWEEQGDGIDKSNFAFDERDPGSYTNETGAGEGVGSWKTTTSEMLMPPRSLLKH